ncbi:hypothetical protein CGLO_14262 [Colletotrichum gloeosporioides Cg-14]|uniref:Uncharacterized protein n=1 Tax=Colletotrichum gloeosporioides (strain Cg-14) TaxID=1237896 RepID=T0K1S4_COLGC|nr:hypothetical protein CGLO_14262 [Colletotrichum gloeosporioides Cg-14]
MAYPKGKLSEEKEQESFSA